MLDGNMKILVLCTGNSARSILLESVLNSFSGGRIVATFGLLLVIFGGIRYRTESVAILVGMYITAAYWFTASTSFANPAVTIARTLSDTFAGINPANAPMFIGCQLLGALLALGASNFLFNAAKT